MTWSSLPRNVARGALLDVDFYDEAENDPALTGQAAVVVVVANLMAGLGSAIATDESLWIGAMLGVVTGVVGWLIWSGVALFVGTKFFAGTSDIGEMLRVIGFAYAPLAIGIIPWLGFVGAAWALVAAVVGIREGMDFSTKRAVITLVAGWGIWLGLSVLVQTFLGLDMRVSWPF